MNKGMHVLMALLFAGATIAEEQAAESKVNRELQKKRHYMRQFDADGDGKLTLAEFTAMTQSEFEKKGKTGYKEGAEKRFKHKDTNKDGYVTPEELVQSLVKLGHLPPEAAEEIEAPPSGN